MRVNVANRRPSGRSDLAPARDVRTPVGAEAPEPAEPVGPAESAEPAEPAELAAPPATLSARDLHDMLGCAAGKAAAERMWRRDGGW